MRRRHRYPDCGTPPRFKVGDTVEFLAPSYQPHMIPVNGERRTITKVKKVQGQWEYGWPSTTKTGRDITSWWLECQLIPVEGD